MKYFEPSQDRQTTQPYEPVTTSHWLTEQDTMSLAALHDLSSTASDKVGNTLSATVQHVIGAGLARLQVPQPEGFSTQGLRIVKQQAKLGNLPSLALTNALGLLLVSFSYYISISGYGNNALEFSFLVGMLLMFVPNMVRLLSAAPSRLERICLLCMLGLCFYLVQFMVSPLHFSSYDEFLHWRTADDILRTAHLFSANAMLPVSPYYPGLEIVTNALSSLSGLSTFQAAILIISASRLLMILSLFLFYEQITGSSRMASIALLIYMANPHFLFFDAFYNYETLALPLATFLFYILVRYDIGNTDHRWILVTAWIVMLAITITHHMTDFFFVGLLLVWAMISFLRPVSRTTRIHLTALALFGLLIAFVYAFWFPGNPVWGYLSQYYGNAFTELEHVITGTTTARRLFTGSGVTRSPIWDELLMIVSVGIVAVGLPFGLLSFWQHHRHNTLAFTFGIISLAYPLSQVFRFTNFGVEITDRAAAFLFLPVAYVLTIFITYFWPTRKLNRKAISLITSLLTVLFLGGVIIEAGAAFSSMPGPYLVIADSRSIEPEGIQTASWTLPHLGPDNGVGTDRINQLLMLTYGDQKIVTSGGNNMYISTVFFSQRLGPQEIAILRRAKIRYLVVDLRMSTSLPLEGFYFQVDEPDAFMLTNPISREALAKFNAIPQIKRVYDSGDIVIYDVGTLTDGLGP